MIEYIKLFWEGAPEGEPSVILYEVDTGNERLALRSIDIFADGRTRNIPNAVLKMISSSFVMEAPPRRFAKIDSTVSAEAGAYITYSKP